MLLVIAAELLSELLALPAGYPGIRNLRRAEICCNIRQKAARCQLHLPSNAAAHAVIQISARGVARSDAENLVSIWYISQPIGGAKDALSATIQHMRINHCGANIPMPEQLLNGSNVVAVFK